MLMVLDVLSVGCPRHRHHHTTVAVETPRLSIRRTDVAILTCIVSTNKTKNMNSIFSERIKSTSLMKAIFLYSPFPSLSLSSSPPRLTRKKESEAEKEWKEIINSSVFSHTHKGCSTCLWLKINHQTMKKWDEERRKGSVAKSRRFQFQFHANAAQVRKSFPRVLITTFGHLVLLVGGTHFSSLKSSFRRTFSWSNHQNRFGSLEMRVIKFFQAERRKKNTLNFTPPAITSNDILFYSKLLFP